MNTLETIITEITMRKHRLDELRKQSPEMADEYHGLMSELRRCTHLPAQIVPSYPVPIWRGWEVTTADNTTGSRLQIIK